MAKKKKVNVQLVKPVIMKELDIEETVKKTAYKPIEFQTTIKEEPKEEIVDDLIYLEQDETIDIEIPNVIEQIIELEELSLIVEELPLIEKTIEFEPLKEEIKPLVEIVVKKEKKKKINKPKIEKIVEIKKEEPKEQSETIDSIHGNDFTIPTVEFLKTEILKINENLEKLKKLKPIKKENASKPLPIKELIEIVKKKKEIKSDIILPKNENIDVEFVEKIEEKPIEISVPEKKISEIIQDHDIHYINTINTLPVDTRTFVSAFIELAKNPFELRYKGIKIFDSHVNSRNEIIFDTKYIIIENGKYPYSNMRIINK